MNLRSCRLAISGVYPSLYKMKMVSSSLQSASHKGFAYNICGNCLFNAYTLPTNIYSVNDLSHEFINHFSLGL